MSQKLFNPDYLYHLCQKYKLSPSKKYGQNFLIDPEPIAKMIEAAEIKKKDTVVEIGPGFGVLTFALVEKAGKVVAFEIEKKLKPYWDTACHHLDTACHPEAKTTCPDSVRKDLPRLEIVWGNVLKEFSADVIVKSERRLPAFGGKQSNPQQRDCRVAALLAMTRYKVIANLPYQITSNVIRIFLEAKNPPELMVLMVQKEVAERICAKPGQMSLLSVSVQYYADAEIVCQVSRSCFWPSPAVDSAVIKLSLRAPRSQDEASPHSDLFFKVVKAGFAQRRKLLFKNLLPVIGKKHKKTLEDIFIKLGLDNNVRAQELSVGDWKTLAKDISRAP